MKLHKIPHLKQGAETAVAMNECKSRNPLAQSAAEIAAKPMKEQEADAFLAAREVTGTQSDYVSERILDQAANAQTWPKLKQEHAMVRTAALMAEMAPQSATEAMLSVQMITVNDLALQFARRAVLPDQHPEAINDNVNRTTRLMRLFAEQVEAMLKLKGKVGHQRVTVEHVHVHKGGQAVVGAIDARKL